MKETLTQAVNENAPNTNLFKLGPDDGVVGTIQSQRDILI